LKVLAKRIRAGSLPEARELVGSLLPLWNRAAVRDERRGVFDKALSVAGGIEAPELAASLLQPFQVDSLTSPRAAALVALVKRYGEEWSRSLIAEWSASSTPWRLFSEKDRRAWLTALPRLCDALCAADAEMGTAAALLLLQNQWGWLREEIETGRGLVRPRERDEMLLQLAGPLLGFLEATALAGRGETAARRGDLAHLRDQAVTFLCADENEALLPCLMRVGRTASGSMNSEAQAAAGLDAIRQRCIRVLQARLAVPERDQDDWSLAFRDDCGCDLCRTLADFLAAAGERELEWPLAKARRKHVHRVVDRHELPVRHETRRSGRPFTLVVTKSEALFQREAAARRTWQADLAWLDT
jgi:hypothetical protein